MKWIVKVVTAKFGYTIPKSQDDVDEKFKSNPIAIESCRFVRPNFIGKYAMEAE